MSTFRLYSTFLYSFTVLAVILAMPAAADDDGQGLALSVGIFNTADATDGSGDEAPVEIGLEYRFKPFHLGGVPIGTALGASATEDGNHWVYFGFRYEWHVSKRVVLIPQTGVGYYEEDDGRDLGGPIEFRSGLEVAFKMRSGRLGFVFYHLSNASIYEDNPGSNSLVMNWAF